MEAVLEAVERTSRGRNEAKRLRVGGHIPAVVYGEKEGGKAIAVDPKILSRILRTGLGANTLIALKMPGGGDTRVLVKEYQIDPVTHQLLHADSIAWRWTRSCASRSRWSRAASPRA